jgi:hypothetical protein
LRPTWDLVPVRLDWFENDQGTANNANVGMDRGIESSFPIRRKIDSLESQVPSGLMSEKKIASIRK